MRHAAAVATWRTLVVIAIGIYTGAVIASMIAFGGWLTSGAGQ